MTQCDTLLNIQGYTRQRQIRWAYVQSHIPGKVRRELGMAGVEASGPQVHLPHCSSVAATGLLALVLLVKRMDVQWCKMCLIQRMKSAVLEIWTQTGLRILTLKKKLCDVASVCNLTQVVNIPARIGTTSARAVSSECIDHCFTDAPEKCSEILSVPRDFRDRHMFAFTSRTNVPEVGPKIIFKRIWKTFSEVELSKLDPKSCGIQCWRLRMQMMHYASLWIYLWMFVINMLLWRKSLWKTWGHPS